MSKTVAICTLFILSGLCEIGGGYLVWGWLRDHKPVIWAMAGAIVLVLYGIVAALQPISEFGRVYAAYGGIFIVMAIGWGMIVDGFKPDRYDWFGACMAIFGSLVMVFAPRS